MRVIVIGDRPWNPPTPLWHVERVAPVYAGAPRWFRGSSSDWGCFLAHQREWRRAARDGVDSLIVFEDDSVFVQEFDLRLLALLRETWDVLLLGGQSAEPPVAFTDRPRNVLRTVHTIRTHAYVLRSAAIRRLSGPLTPPTRPFDWDWQRNWLYPLDVVQPRQWLAGQAAGPDTPEQWWEDSERR